MLYDVEGFGDTRNHPLPAAAAWPALWPAAARRRPVIDPATLAQLACKRTLDIVASLLLLLLLSPLLLAIAVAVRLVDRVPVLYRQERYGRFGVPFVVLKFRTMVCDEPGRSFVQATAGDARVTRLGAFLRRTSLDELPQLFNVLFGDMSLVGPRPHPVSMEEAIISDYPPAARRLAMRPGMTGEAQVRGLRGPTADAGQLRARLDADIAYVDDWTLWSDVAILLRTPAALIAGENAL